ncbi:MAG: DUF4325 domain-containing protein [Candidatus Peregrinibacteria bacterium]|nr:DUF4325 domain-containing protein [Candidatus Peregrinibacteria bacterium]
MSLRDDITVFVLAQKNITTPDIVRRFRVSRQYASTILRDLVRNGKLVKAGSTRSAEYATPMHSGGLRSKSKYEKIFARVGLQEDEVLEVLLHRPDILRPLSENVRAIFAYAFSEMLNNAIEHSGSRKVRVSVETGSDLVFRIQDAGVGVFRNVMRKRHLQSEWEAMQDLLKGKTTTQPQSHSGEGIFFTSKIADEFSLESFGYKLTIDNRLPDVFVEQVTSRKRGTTVHFRMSSSSSKNLNDLFRQYQKDPSEFAFDKTEIQVRLYTFGTIHISRSQARRLLAGLDKFKLIILDFERVPTVGQAFADEIFRVFTKAHPHIVIRPIHMNEAVRFMVGRVGK